MLQHNLQRVSLSVIRIKDTGSIVKERWSDGLSVPKIPDNFITIVLLVASESGIIFI